MSETMTIGVRMEAITCCHEGCGITFAVPSWWESGRRDSHEWWYCPNGHSQCFPEKSVTEKLRAQLTRAQQDRDFAETRATDNAEWARRTERQLSAQRGVTTRIKNRVAKGVCPCCNRTFANLARHMNTKHPDYAESDHA